MRKVRKAVITAAGRGTRQYPASSAVQKEMFPLMDRDGLTKPVINIVEKPSVEVAREKLVTPGLPAGNYLSHFGIHVFGPIIFDTLGYMIANDLRENGEFQLTAAQELARQQTDKSWVAIERGLRCDTGTPYGLMETQLALALAGVHRADICEAIARLMAQQTKR